MIPVTKKQKELDHLLQRRADLKQQEKDLRAKIRTSDLKANRQLCFAIGTLIVEKKDDARVRQILSEIMPDLVSESVRKLLAELLA